MLNFNNVPNKNHDILACECHIKKKILNNSKPVPFISAIVCVDENWAIGNKNGLLVNIPEDMAFFKRTTMDKVIVMGRKTYESFPKRPLPNRLNIVISSSVSSPERKEDGSVWVNLDFIKNKLGKGVDRDVVVVGGGQIYKELLPYCQKAYVTKVFHAYEEVDTYFPNLDKSEEWKLEFMGFANEYNGLKYQFREYVQKL